MFFPSTIPVQFFAAYVIISFCIAPSFEGGNEESGQGRVKPGNKNESRSLGNNPRRLTEEQIKRLKQSCVKRPNACKGQLEHAIRKRNDVKQHLMRQRGGGKKIALKEAEAEARLQKIHQAKLAVFAANGLADIEPHDNGAYGHDMLLNVQQAERIINRAKGIITDKDVTSEIPLLDPESLLYKDPYEEYRSREKRGQALNLDKYRGSKWPSAIINFYIHSDVAQEDANEIRNALEEISNSTCLKFEEGWNNDSVVEYLYKPGDTMDGDCGLSEVGYQGGYQSVSIKFNDTICSKLVGHTITHETLHTIGLTHEHTRYDRDTYLNIDWDNLDPQLYDAYNTDDPRDHSPYCIPYDPLSVGAIDKNKPVMQIKSHPDFFSGKMGTGEKMSAKDIHLINKIYCTKSKGCEDESSSCGWSACGNCTVAVYERSCPRSCGKC